MLCKGNREGVGETREVMEQRSNMMRYLEQLRAEMELIRQHNQAVYRQRERGNFSSFDGPPPTPTRET
eukprot:6388767-Prorocentrum_lima.AAC.1